MIDREKRGKEAAGSRGKLGEKESAGEEEETSPLHKEEKHASSA
jgi:hypothetical protein